jgi:hypothetical protein
MMKKCSLGASEADLDITRAGLYAWRRQKKGATRAAGFILSVSGDELVLEERAFAAGRLVGQLEALRLALAAVLESRFGNTLVADRLRQLAAIDDPRILHRYFAAALRCRTLAEFLRFQVLT